MGQSEQVHGGIGRISEIVLEARKRFVEGEEYDGGDLGSIVCGVC